MFYSIPQIACSKLHETNCELVHLHLPQVTNTVRQLFSWKLAIQWLVVTPPIISILQKSIIQPPFLPFQGPPRSSPNWIWMIFGDQDWWLELRPPRTVGRTTNYLPKFDRIHFHQKDYVAVLQPEIKNFEMGKGFKSQMKYLRFQRAFLGVYKGEVILETAHANVQST